MPNAASAPFSGRVVLDARTATDHFPGIGRYVVNLAAALKRVEPGLDLALLVDPTAPAQRLTLPDLPAIECPISPFSPRQQAVVPALLRRAGARLYHSAYYLMPYWPGVRSVVTVYDMIPLVYPAYYTATQRIIFRAAHMLALAAARVTLCISAATQTDVARRFQVDPARIRVTPLAADPAMTPQPAEAIVATRQQYGLPERYVLYLGSNKPHKNLVRLVEAWAGAGRRAPDYTLVIAGHWDARYPEVRERAAALGLGDRVYFAGPVAEVDLPALYSGADCFAFPSLYEGFGLPVQEAMACGCPVVCSDTSSLPEVAGDAARLVDPLNVDALAGALDEVLTDADLRADMRRRSLAQAARFTWEETARGTLAAYCDAMR
jgi:glycosyltransferase involved in cell wall biosynthesis